MVYFEASEPILILNILFAKIGAILFIQINHLVIKN